jgi:ribosome-associated translation inhibitor RaiA
MKINFSLHDIDESCKKKLEDYANEEKLNSLVRLLPHDSIDSAILDIRAEYMVHHNNFEIKMVFKIPRHVLEAEQSGFSITEAFDLALDKIVVQMKKIEEIRHHK